MKCTWIVFVWPHQNSNIYKAGRFTCFQRHSGFPPFKEHKIQGLSQDFQGPSYAYSRREMCKIIFVLNFLFFKCLIMLNSPITFTIVSKQHTLFFLAWLNLSVSQQQENSRTFKDLYCFARTFQARNFISQIQGLSRIFKDRGNPDHCNESLSNILRRFIHCSFLKKPIPSFDCRISKTLFTYNMKLRLKYRRYLLRFQIFRPSFRTTFAHWLPLMVIQSFKVPMKRMFSLAICDWKICKSKNLY